MTAPQTLFMTPSSFSPKRSRNSDTMTVSAENQSTEAEVKPRINAAALPAGSEARNAPIRSVPSMMACGLIHVTTKAVPASRHRLAPALRELERDGLVARQEYLEVPVRVEYRATEAAMRLQPILDSLSRWGEERMRTDGY